MNPFDLMKQIDSILSSMTEEQLLEFNSIMADESKQWPGFERFNALFLEAQDD